MALVRLVAQVDPRHVVGDARQIALHAVQISLQSTLDDLVHRGVLELGGEETQRAGRRTRGVARYRRGVVRAQRAQGLPRLLKAESHALGKMRIEEQEL